MVLYPFSELNKYEHSQQDFFNVILEYRTETIRFEYIW